MEVESAAAEEPVKQALSAPMRDSHSPFPPQGRPKFDWVETVIAWCGEGESAAIWKKGILLYQLLFLKSL